MHFWKSKQEKIVDDQSEILKTAVAGINDLVKEINQLVDAKKDGENETKNHTD